MRRTLTYVWSLLCLCFITTTAVAQNGLYDVRFAIKNFNCAKDSVTIQVQVKAHDAAHTFLMGDANYRFDYDPRVINGPKILSEENYSNQAPSSDLNYGRQNLNGSSAGLTLGTVSLNTFYGQGGLGAKLVTTSWTTVTCIGFKVQDPTKCMSLIWHDNNRFPVTGMNEVELLPNSDYNLYEVTAGGIFGNYSECIPSVCSNLVALNDINVTPKNTATSGNLLTNDISATTMTATTTPLVAALNGVLTIAPNGAYTYTPNANFVGKDSARYKVCNAAGICDSAWLFVTIFEPPVSGVNSNPIANPDNGVTYINTPLSSNVLTNDIDPDGNTLTVNPIPLVAPKNGTLVLNTNGTYIYTPNNAFIGQDTFYYKVCDSGIPSKCDSTSVVINVLNNTVGGTGNLPPTPNDDAYETYKNITLTGNLKLNDSDPNVGQLLKYDTAALVLPLHGTVKIDSTTGIFTYIPTAGYVGPDEFIYRVCDNGIPKLCSQATAHIVIVNAPNEKPVVTVTPQIVGEDTTKTFCLPIVDPNALDTHTVTACAAPTGGGTATAVVDNVAHTLCITYKSAPNYNGQDTLCFIVCDNGVPSKCDTVKIPVTVTPINDKPVITVTPITIKEDSIVTFCMPFTDPDVGQTYASTLCGVGNGTATTTIVGNTVCVTYTPTLNYNGADTVCVIVCDNGVPSKCDTVKVPITLTPVNDKPVITVVPPQTTVEDSTIIICTTITDPDGASVFTASMCGVQHGTGVPSVSGNQLCITYTPTLNYNGPDTVCVIVCDNGVPSKCDTLKIPIVVTPVNDKPVVVPTPIVIGEDSTVTVCLPITDPDVGQTHTATPCGARNGTVTAVVTAGQVCITYVPTLNFNGRDTACVIICDNGTPSKCDTVKLPITITPVNDKPVITVVTPKTTVEDSTIIICTTITDPDGGTPVFAATLCGVQNGTAVPSVVGNQLCITYTPNLNYNGPDTVCVIVCDNGIPSKCDTLKIPITVTPVNDKPVVTVTPVTVKEDTTITVCFPITDPDAGQTFTSTPCGARNGTVTSVVTAGQVCVTYTPTANYYGTDTICVIVCDNGSPSKCDTAKIPVTVTPVNDKPIVPDATAVTPNTLPVTVCVPITDADPTDSHTISLCGAPTLGSINGVVNNATHQLCVTYTPTAGAVGTDRVCIIVCDNGSPSKCDTTDLTFIVGSTNDKPVAMNDVNVTLKNMPVSGNVKMNDTDPNFNVLTVNTTPVQGPVNGVITFNSNGTYTYTPVLNFVGTDIIKYQICDNGVPSLCDTATLTIEVRDVSSNNGNQAPVATDDNTATPAGQPIVIAVKANDFDPQNGTIGNPTLFGTPVGGTPSVNPDGTVTFTPTPGFVGDAIFTYYVCDNGTPSLCDSATVTVIVYPNPTQGNIAPVAIDDAYPVTKDTPFSGTVATNDYDQNAGQLLSFTAITTATRGAVTLLSNGQVSYVPTTGFVGIDSFKYKVCDNGTPSLCDTAVVIFNITAPIVPPTNVAPVATDDIATTVVNTPVVINVKANDYDPNGGQILTNPTIVGTPVGGTATVNPDGTIKFVPTTGFTGTATIVYQVCDNGIPSLCDLATVTITVIPTPALSNRPPVAGNDAFVTAVNTVITNTVATNDSDPDAGQSLSFTRLITPNNGVVSINPTTGAFVYTPLALFVGIDSFQYKVCDNGSPSLCDTAWVFVTIANPIGTPNVAPTANDDNSATQTGTPVTINVKANDFDLNPNTTLTNPTIVGTPVGGTTVVNPDGTVTFTPNPGFTGTATFKYAVCDNGTPSLCDTATVTVDVTTPTNYVNLAPIAVRDATTTPINTPVAGNAKTNDSDLNVGQTLTYATVPVTNPLRGSIVLQADGTYVYTPNAGFVGLDSAQYRVCDNGTPSLCATAWIVIDVTAAGVNNNMPPVVTKDNAGTTKDMPVVINVKANDYDPNAGQTLGLPTIVGTVPNGTATVNPDGTITFVPTTGFTGTTTFTYQVCDNGFAMACNSATVTVVVTPTPATINVNLAPVAVDDAHQTLKNTVVNGNAATNDNDPNVGQSLTFSLLTPASHGVVSLAFDGTYRYTPVAGFTGNDQFTYKICDNGTPTMCDTATVYITIYDFPCVTINLKVLLEGPLYLSPNAGVMRTTLNERGLLPGQTPVGQFAVATPAGHPYSGAPWNLVDTTGITMTTYDPDVTDWVLVSLRTDNVLAANVLRVPALLMKDGTVRFINPCFAVPNGNYFIVIEHRNHMGAMSPSAVAIVNGVINFDFTTGNSLITTNVNNPPAFGQKLIGTKWAMYAGDGRKNTPTTNFDINFNDSQLWKLESGNFDQYRQGDHDMNADVNFQDQVLWKNNNGRYSIIPH